MKRILIGIGVIILGIVLANLVIDLVRDCWPVDHQTDRMHQSISLVKQAVKTAIHTPMTPQQREAWSEYRGCLAAPFVLLAIIFIFFKVWGR